MPTDFRRLPAIHSLLDLPEVTGAIVLHGRDAVLHALRSLLGEKREDLKTGMNIDVEPSSLAALAIARLRTSPGTLRPVINATGVLLHTGLGRAPLAAGAVEAVSRVARGYCNLEFDLETGRRGERSAGVEGLIRRLTGAAGAAVVNNNAAATILALRATAKDRDVLVSRGQLVEIGGSFRLPEIFEVSGARLREVGTTNKTRLMDYERAIGPETGALLRVHPSNYRVVGFTESVGIQELARLGKARGLATIDDIGSGAIDESRPPGIAGEPTVREGLDAGADLVLFSGDKLLGGPQCGLLIGSQAAIARVKADPLFRAVRVDKMTLAALEVTLSLAVNHQYRELPLWNFLSVEIPTLRARAERLAARLRDEGKWNARAVETQAQLGGGSLPMEPLASAAVRVDPPWPDFPGEEGTLARRLRTGEPAVVSRVQDGGLLLDLRAVPEADDAVIFEAMGRLVVRSSQPIAGKTSPGYRDGQPEESHP